MKPPFPILYEDNHLLIVDKPAALPTMGVEAGRPSVIEALKEYLKRKYDKPGNVYLGIVSRLDAPVTGVLVTARTSKAAARLNEQFRSQEVEKVYWALVSPPPEEAQEQLSDWVRKDERHRKMHVCTEAAPGAQLARLSYRTLQRRDERALLEVRLETGRKHQIRLQLGSRGSPVVGDRKYGSKRAFPAGIALHSRRLILTHPVKKTPIEIEAPLPDSWGRVKEW